MAPTLRELSGQWRNPNDVLSVVLIIGSGTVRSALAQLAGNSTFVPVCFSFGWVSLALENIISIAGEGRLMPDPDYPCKIINAESGYGRENRSWMLGRLLRDSEPYLTHESLCITVWKGVGGVKVDRKAGHGQWYSPMSIMNGTVMVIQLAIAAIPWITEDHDWGVFLIAAVGTMLSLMTGALPQWRAEKFSCRTNESNKNVLVTKGVGSRHAMLIIGDGHGLDMEDLAGGESPRSFRMWQNFYNMDQNKYRKNLLPTGTGTLGKSITLGRRMGEDSNEPVMIRELPRAFWITRVLCVIFAILWVCLLISVAGLKTNAWFLLLVGAIGMVQNSFVAGYKQNWAAAGIYLDKAAEIKGDKGVMNVLMELEMKHSNAGLSLMQEYFPGELRPAESAWWDAARMRLAEERHDKAVKKRMSSGGGGDAPSPPTWQAQSQKYGSMKEWQNLCATKYEPTPFEKLPPEAHARVDVLLGTAATTSGSQEKSQAVQIVTPTGSTP